MLCQQRVSDHIVFRIKQRW